MFEGDVVGVTVNLGTKKVQVPKVTELRLEKAESALVSAGLKYTVKEGYNVAYEDGTIYAQSVGAGTVVDADTTIVITVCRNSKNPQQQATNTVSENTTQAKDVYHTVEVYTQYPSSEGDGNEHTEKHGDTFTTKSTTTTTSQYTPDLSGYDDSGSCGKNVYWGVNKSEGELKIFGIGQMKSGVSTGDWSKYSENIKKVIIDEGVTSIGSFAFYRCKNIVEVEIASSVKLIDDGAFTNCVSLEEIYIPSGVNEISDSAFQQCASLKSINVDTLNTSFSSDSGVLFNKNKTTLLRYPPAKNNSTYTVPQTVTLIDEMSFLSCLNLTSISLPSSLQSIESQAFWDCENLKNILIPSSVTKIGAGAFSNCYSLKSVDISKNVITLYGSAFTYCNALESINVSVDNKYYKSVDGVLYDKAGEVLMHYPASKSSLSFSIPHGVTTIESYAFAYALLTSIDIPNSVTTIGSNAFEGCTKITSITLPDSITTMGMTVFFKWKSTQTIYVKGYSSAPSGWSSGWNYNSPAKIVWNA